MRVVREAGLGWIRKREINQRAAGAAMFGKGFREAVFGEVPIGTRSKHKEGIVQQFEVLS